MRYILVVVAIAVAVAAVWAATPQEILQGYAAHAWQADPGFTEFSAERGRTLFLTKRVHSTGLEVSCTSCHTDNAAAAGKHRKTGKAIQPLAPAANPERLTDLAKVEKWFKRNCNDVLERECTALEKGDVIAYLLSVK